MANHGQEPRYKVLVIGSSWGGVEALTTLVSALPPGFSPGVIVVQHQHPHSRDALAHILARHSRLPVRDVEDKDDFRGGEIFLAPANYHLLLEKDLSFSLSLDTPVQYCRPSLDVTFDSVARAFEHRSMALVLTGANEDGAEGVRAIRKAGGYTMAQEPTTAIAPTMPAAAIATGCIDTVLRLGDVVPHLLQILEEKHGNEAKHSDR